MNVHTIAATRQRSSRSESERQRRHFGVITFSGQTVVSTSTYTTQSAW